ncbi:MAG: alpha/beta superfamily hydrolase [Halieaceae bacterium]|jgi:alpha/beta superfamily hydrolase
MTGSWQAPDYDEIATVSLQRIPVMPAVAEVRTAIDGPAGRLGASLIVSEGGSPFPGVVFLHGSGPQTRDANRWATFALAELGVASVIYDKRGVGESEGNFVGASLEDLARDGIAAAEFLRAQPGVSIVGFAGHSQGGWIGPLAGSLWSPTAFVISSSGPAVAPSRETQEILQGFIAADNDITLRMYPGYNHGMRRLGARWPSLPRGYYEVQACFMQRAAGVAEASKSTPAGQPDV